MDIKHIIVKDIKLPGNAELHHFKNSYGTDYSAIYKDGTEIFSCEIDKEYSMIKYYNMTQRIHETY